MSEQEKNAIKRALTLYAASYIRQHRDDYPSREFVEAVAKQLVEEAISDLERRLRTEDMRILDRSDSAGFTFFVDGLQAIACTLRGRFFANPQKHLNVVAGLFEIASAYHRC